MVLDAPRGGRHLLLCILCCVACGGDVSLRLGFELPEGTAVLAGTTTVDMWATRSDTRIAFTTSDYEPGLVLGLEEIDKEGPALHLFLTTRDTDGAPTAFGELGPPVTSTIADVSDVCCLTMCLCTVSYRSTNPCDCGSSRCDACN